MVDNNGIGAPVSRGEKITRLAECSWLAQSVFRDWPPLTIPRERVTERQEITPYKWAHPDEER